MILKILSMSLIVSFYFRLSNDNSGCTSGCNIDVSNVPFNKFPNDQDLCQKWIGAVHQENFKPLDSLRVCGLHFHEVDYSTDSADSNKHGKSETVKLFCCILNYLSPYIFPNLPTYLI